MWIMEVRIVVDESLPTADPKRYEWRAVHPTGGARYEYATQHEAASMLRMCYPDAMGDARIREVSA